MSELNTIMAEKFIKHVENGHFDWADDAQIVALQTAYLSQDRDLIGRVLEAKKQLDALLASE